MRLLFLSNFYPPLAIGGYELWCEEVATKLNERGHTVHILTSRYGLQHCTAQADPLPVQRTLNLMTDLDYYAPARFLRDWRTEEEHNRRELLSAISASQPDVVLVWGMWNLSLNLPYWAEHLLPGRVAYYLSSYWPIDVDAHHAYWNAPANSLLGRALKQPLRHWANRRLRTAGYPPALRFCHSVCCSHYVRNTLIAAKAVPSETGVLQGGTDPAPFLAAAAERPPAADRQLRLLYFGRLVSDKGVHTILEALAILNAQIDLSRLRLTILGSGHPDYEDSLRRFVEQNQLTDCVDFISQVHRSDVPKYLGQHDVYLFSSIWAEPMARSVMEAMAAKLLVIGSEVGGQMEMLQNGVNSLTFSAGDAAGLARQIALALADPELRVRLAAAGQSLVLSDFTLDRMVDRIEAWLGTVADAA
jgi:glycogen synthase